MDPRDGSLERGYERTDLSFLAVAGVGALLLLFVLVAGAVLWFATHSSLAHIPRPEPLPPAEHAKPALQLEPRRDLARLRARETALLEGYGWVDREHGVAHIPIERAMRIMAEPSRSGRREER